MPLLVGLDGKEKMSKSKGNYIGVTDEPGDMFGKIMSISDDMMENYFTLLTDLPAEEIASLVEPNKTHPKEAKVLLARTIVNQFCPKPPDDDSAFAAWLKTVPASQAVEMTIGDFSVAEFDRVFAQGQTPAVMPKVELPAKPISVKQLLLLCKLVSTGGQAKRMVLQAAVSVDGNKISDPNVEITPRNGMVIQVGKRKFTTLIVK
jgi:tyrosyl-tRNA synthetase